MRAMIDRGMSGRRSRVPKLLLAVALVVPLLMVATAPASGAPVPWEYDATFNLLSFPPPADHVSTPSPAPHVADWNDDGRDDLIVGMHYYNAPSFGGIAVYLRNPDGTLAAPFSAFASGDAHTATGWAVYFRPTFGDLDGDDINDLVYGQYYGTKGVVFCSNTGTNAAPVFHGASCVQLTTTGGPLVGATTGSSVAYVSPELVDWDGDDDLDLLVGTGASATEKGVRYYENIGTTPVLADPVTVVAKGVTGGLTYENYYEPAAVDFDDDGDLDLLVGGSRYLDTSTFVLRICLNPGDDDGLPDPASCSYRIEPGLINNVVDFTDWDQDGYLDMITGYASGYIVNPVKWFHGMGPDPDGDGLSDSIDNCPSVFNPPTLKLDGDNPVQLDTDVDGAGDACDDDDDDDTVGDGADNCPWTPNETQADVDGDGAGDACDPNDDRIGHPGIGTYEWEQAERIAFGEKPAIVLRVDALSLSYRREVAEALIDEALGRGIPITLAVIPWNAERYVGSDSAAYLNSVAADPNLEIAQHGTYHSCKLVGGVGAESDCGMNEAESYNLMRVGYDSLNASVTTTPSHAYSGFVPPEDAFDDESMTAMRSLGYTYVASSFYREAPEFVYTDANGLVHVPWSQIACGNASAPWIDCSDQGVDAHSGPDLDPVVGMKERVRNDFERYGAAVILFELASYDGDYSQGTLDPAAFASFQAVLDDLEELVAETGAEFMTIADFAAAQLVDTGGLDGLKLGVELFFEAGEITSRGFTKSLLAKLTRVEAMVGRGDYESAIDMLGSFIDSVAAQTGKKVSVDAAAALTSAATYLIGSY